MLGDVPRHSDRMQLRGDEAAGRFRGEQEAQASPVGRGRQRRLLPGEFGEGGVDVMGHLLRAPAPAGDVEEGLRLPDYRGGDGSCVPLLGSPQRRGLGDEFGADEDRMSEPEVVGAVDAHPGRKQRRGPLGGVAEHPPRRRGRARAKVIGRSGTALTGTDEVGKDRLGEVGSGDLPSGRVEIDDGDRAVVARTGLFVAARGTDDGPRDRRRGLTRHGSTLLRAADTGIAHRLGES